MVKKLLSVVLGLGLFGLGVLLFVAAPQKPGYVSAQTGQTVNTTWTATQFVNIRAHNEGTYAGPVTIGVTKWHNETLQDGNKIYEEDWAADVPASNTITFSGSLSAFTKSSWIYGVVGGDVSSGSPFTFTFTDTAVAEKTTGPFGRRSERSIGNSADCVSRGGNATCITGTGAYGFSLNQLGDGVGNWPVATGALIPMKWTVVGHIY